MPDFAAILDESDRLIARSMFLKKMEKNLSMLAEIKKEKPRLYALTEMNISEIKTSTNFDTYEF